MSEREKEMIDIWFTIFDSELERSKKESRQEAAFIAAEVATIAVNRLGFLFPQPSQAWIVRDKQ